MATLGKNPAEDDARICFAGATSIRNFFAERIQGPGKEIRISVLSIRALRSRSGQAATARCLNTLTQLGHVAPFGEQLISVRANTGSRGGASASARCTRQNKNTLRLLILAGDQPSIPPPPWGRRGGSCVCVCGGEGGAPAHAKLTVQSCKKGKVEEKVHDRIMFKA